MRRLALPLVFVLGIGVGAGVACTPGAVTALEVLLSPYAGDALATLVQERWGPDAECDVETAGCFRTDEQCGAQLVGDDDIDFVYSTCRCEAAR